MSANFSPDMEEYSGIRPFRFWCQKVLPLVYDDSLSYYELLCRVTSYINNIVSDLSATETNVDNLKDAYDELEDYVNDYFDDLDIQSEINDKLDAMAADGTLTSLVGPIVTEMVPTLVTNWLNTNVDPTGSAVTVDSSLSVGGSAADSEIVGLVTGELETFLFSDNLWNDLRRDGVVTSSDKWARTNCSHILLPVTPGDTIAVTAADNQETILGFFTSNVVGESGSDAPFVSGQSRISVTRGTSATYTVPAGTKYLYMTYEYSGSSFLPSSLTINGVTAKYAIYDYATRMLKYAFKNIKELTNADNIDTLAEYGIYWKAANVQELGGTKPPFEISESWAILNYAYGYAPADVQSRHMQFCLNRTTGEFATRNRVAGGWTTWAVLARTSELAQTADNNIIDYTTDSFTGTDANAGTKITVMSYNVANYNNDTLNYISEARIFNFKKMLNEAKPDFIGVQEDRLYLDGDDEKLALSYIYKPIFPFKYGDAGLTIYSKIESSDAGIVVYSNGRSIRYALFDVGGKDVLIVSTHPVYDYDETGGESAESIAARATQYDELFKWLAGTITLYAYGTTTDVTVPTHDYAIICGDMNCVTSSDKTTLKGKISDNGYTAANGGWLGWLQTNVLGESIDNVIVDENCVINSIDAMKSWGEKLYSDHYPIVAEITLKD